MSHIDNPPSSDSDTLLDYFLPQSSIGPIRNTRKRPISDNTSSLTSEMPKSHPWSCGLLDRVAIPHKLTDQPLDNSTPTIKSAQKSFHLLKFKLIKAKLFNDYKKIAEYSTDMLAIHPNSYAIRYIRADAYRALLEYKKAKLDLDHVISLNQKSKKQFVFEVSCNVFFEIP
ncbi:16402_t:CDS:2 [Funneliformis geosporum]|uniref:16402_t:CDS:1 n=1 Tax=Funneliformis geosporum TaxID=1117311 RepID=A0A9W4SZF8_9GLOM|nr:16402_t:CDS:2 [Funneliformis geosporum]